MRPLYDSDVKILPPSGNGNLGLWYDKFYDQWQRKGSNIEHSAQGKAKWIQDIVSACRPWRTQSELPSRLARLVRAQGGRFWVFETIDALVTGLGKNHPIENGFAWHHLSGEPYLPGSSIKGMLKAWTTWMGAPEADLGPIIDQVTLFDGLAMPPIVLKAEVMTPHYSRYYRGDGAPSDDDQPIPIPFLAVGPGQQFLLAGLGSAEHLDRIEQALVDALEWMGIGAKTSSGFGRLGRKIADESKLLHAIEVEEANAARAERRRTMPPWQVEMLDDGYEESPDRFMAVAQKWLARMEDLTIDAGERYQIAVKLDAWYQGHQDPRKKGPSPKYKEKRRRILAVLEASKGER